MSIFTCSGEIPFFAMQQEEFISGCPSSPAIYRVETHITGQMNLRLDQIDLRPLNAVISCFRMCVVKNIDMFSFDTASDVLSDILDTIDQKVLPSGMTRGSTATVRLAVAWVPVFVRRP